MEGGNWSLSKQDTSVLKGIAIVAMLFHHLYCSIPAWIEPYLGVLGWMGDLGKVCVAMFLFCSGYGLSAQFDDVKGAKNSFKYMLKRFVSFYFNYWVVFLVFVPITVFCFGRPLSVPYGEHVNIVKRLGLDLLGLQGGQSYNITWWFNKLLIILYLLFPLLYFAASKNGVVTLAISLLVCVCWMPVVGYDYYGMLYVNQLPFVCGILWNKWGKTGCNASYEAPQQSADSNLPSIGSKRSVCILAGVVLFLLVMVLFRMYPIIPWWTSVQLDAFVTAGVAMLVVSLRKMGVSMRLLAFLGKHSANIYFIHTFYNLYWHFSWLHNGAAMRSGVNFFVLLSLCLLTSIILEWIKTHIGVYKLLGVIKLRLE